MNLEVIFLVFSILFQISVSKKDAKSETEDSFRATNEWKEIKEGQKVPSGLHYKINLSTGKKEAKILTPEDDDKTKSFVLKDDTDTEESEGTITTPEMEQFLKKVNKKKSKFNMPSKLRTMDEILEELGDIELQPKSDLAILQELFKKFQEEAIKNANELSIITILKDLTYLGHQIDNANEFYNLDGFRKIIYKQLNSTNIAIKHETLKLFSVLAQNNPKVKVHILETGGIAILSRIINQEDNDLIKNSALTALSCTLRTFPHAQNKFIEIGGLSILTESFKTGTIKLKLKIVTLLNDLIVERQSDADNFENHGNLDIDEALFKLDWCNLLNELMNDLIEIDLTDFDSIEKCLLSMGSLANKCQNVYKNEPLLKLYKTLLRNEDAESDYLQYLKNLTSQLVGTDYKLNKEEL
ncbi:unnamed protein product [Ceutorhynchus assimilis]|uniref:Nucleotide exchange factor SIL1 n=1 Tax=Ceutorhynchus assimilis TaxID=467358 RepID=A0A9N9Q9A5_9CUCU|nr:unnamed protein product [Ceutorhynchus assimilis]